MQHLNVDRVLSRLEQRGALKVAAAVTDLRKITPTVSQVLITSSDPEGVSSYDLSLAIASATSNHASPIPKSFHRINGAGLPAFVGFVRANREVKPYETATVSKMRVLAKNMYMDASDDSLWAVKTAADGQRLLCRQTNDDLSKLLASVQKSVPRAPRLRQLAQAINVGDAVAFVDVKNEVVRHGFVAASEVDPETEQQTVDVITTPEQGEDAPVEQQMQQQDAAFACVTVPSDLVVCAQTFPNRFFSKEVAAPRDANNLASLRDYYSTLYRYSPEYVSKIMKQIDQLAAV